MSAKKIGSDKNKTLNNQKKICNSPRASQRARWTTTGKKINSKYSWTGKVISNRSKRTIFQNSSSPITENQSESGFGSITRTPSPVDLNFYYGKDPQTRMKVFGLNSSFGSLQDPHYDTTDDEEISGEWNVEIEENENDDDRDNSIGKRFSDIQQTNSWVEDSNLCSLTIFDDKLYRSYASENNENYSISLDREMNSRQSTSLCRRLVNSVLTLIKNLIFFLILPVIYVAFFVYMHDEK